MNERDLGDRLGVSYVVTILRHLLTGGEILSIDKPSDWQYENILVMSGAIILKIN